MPHSTVVLFDPAAVRQGHGQEDVEPHLQELALQIRENATDLLRERQYAERRCASILRCRVPRPRGRSTLGTKERGEQIAVVISLTELGYPKPTWDDAKTLAATLNREAAFIVLAQANLFLAVVSIQSYQKGCASLRCTGRPRVETSSRGARTTMCSASTVFESTPAGIGSVADAALSAYSEASPTEIQSPSRGATPLVQSSPGSDVVGALESPSRWLLLPNIYGAQVHRSQMAMDVAAAHWMFGQYAALSLARPWADPLLASWDRALGFDVPALVAWTESRRGSGVWYAARAVCAVRIGTRRTVPRVRSVCASRIADTRCDC